MKDFTLSQQYAILGLDGIESLHSSFAKNAVIRGIFVARELEKIFENVAEDMDPDTFSKMLQESMERIRHHKKKDDQIADLQAKLLKSDLQKKATASLEKDGYPVGLAELLDYTSEEAMEKSLSKLIETFKGSLQTAVESRLRGKTPAGLGNAASAENMLRDQIARNIRGL